MPLPEVVSAAAGFLLWELGLAALSALPLKRVSCGAEKLALLLAFHITLASLAATALSFLRANSQAAYLAIAIACLAIAVRRNSLPRFPPRRSGLAFLPALLLAITIRPVEEIDSLYNLHYVLGWYLNQTTPFEYAYNYVPFWELSYLPGLVLSRSDLFLWFQSLKAVALLGLLLFLLARELALPERLTIWLAGMVMAFPHLWTGPSGVSTTKNDMLHAAGQAAVALLTVRAVKRSTRPTDPVLLALAVIFLCVKFSGPVLLAVGGAVAVAAGFRSVRLAAGVASAWLITVGIYYIRNTFTYGNPFYPFEINLFFFHLPGRADLSYSSILHNLHDPRLWKAFFWPQGGLSPAGLLFPLILTAILVGSVLVVVLELRKRRLTLLLASALFQMVVWGVYVRSIYSASGFPSDLAFVLNDLNSLRYVEGALLVAEVFLASLLVAKRVPAALVWGLIVVHGASRVWLVVRRETDVPWLFAGVLAVALCLLSGRWKLAAPTLLLIAGIYRIEQRRPEWLPRYQPLYLPLYELPPQRISYIVEDEFSQQHCAHLPLMGRRLQHQVVTGRTPERDAGWIVWLRRQPEDPAPTLPPGFTVAVETPAGVLLQAEN
jgi:hypothetical protein